MRILITGSEGTLGKYLTMVLRQRGHEVYGADLKHNADPKYSRCDVSEYRQVEYVIEKVRPQVVYHLAAEFGRMNGEHYYEQLWKNNAIGTRNLIDVCIKYNAHLVFASSSEAYGDLSDKNGYLHEDLLINQAPSFHNEYALSKWANERQVEMAVKHRGLSATVLRFFNAYGPGEFYSPYRSVVCLFAYRLMNGIPITVYKDYHRVFMYVDDWAETVANVADLYERLPNGIVINVGGEEYKSVEELKDKLIEIIKPSNPIVNVLEKEKANVTNKRPDITRARQLLGHNPHTTLDEGLPLTVDWLKRMYE